MRIVRADESSATVELNRTELVALNNALGEICGGPEAIEDWEFHTRIGVERQEARRLLTEIGTLLRT